MLRAPFRKTIASWRELLARDVADHTPGITGDGLALVVDRAIVRCLFLRLCENRGILPLGTLADLSAGTDIGARISTTYRGITAGSGIPDDPAAPPIGDAPLRAILAALCEPQHPCQFAALPLDVLGQVHEYCLARPLRLGTDQLATPAGKATTRKASGSFYTPGTVVDYLVRRTIGDLLDGKVPSQVGELAMLDPACGSGAFLLGTYQFLLDWHLHHYLNAGTPQHCEELCQNERGEWQLVAAERRRILLTHVYGVDRDARPVEIAGLTLLLKLLEGSAIAPGATAQAPDLSRNLVCGDALVGPDIREHPAASSLGDEEFAALNPLDWHAAFPAIMARGGFDAVIGNPPFLSYSGRQAVALPEPLRRYLFDRYAGTGWPSAHTFFVALAIRRLARRRIAFVVPDQVGHLARYALARALLARQARLVEVRYWGEDVFADAITPALTFVADRVHTGPTTIYDRNGVSSTATFADDRPWQTTGHAALLAKLWQKSESLGALVADPGVHTGNCAARLILPPGQASAGAVPILEGKQIGRYRCAPPTRALRLDYSPGPGEYFTIRPEARYADAPFVIRQTAPYPIVGPRRHAIYFRNSLLALYPPDDGRAVEYLVGLLNSTLMRYVYIEAVREARQRAFPQVKIGALRSLPIRRLDLADPRERACHDQIVAAVRQMVLLCERCATAGEAALSEEIAATEAQIDRLIYQLYGLSADEIGRVEAAVSRPE